MYKTQMKLQKILCLLAIFASALVFIYSLGIMTDLYDSLYFTMMDPTNPDDTWVPGSQIYYNMQPFNKELLASHIRGCVARDIRDGKDDVIDELVTTLQKLMK